MRSSKSAAADLLPRSVAAAVVVAVAVAVAVDRTSRAARFGANQTRSNDRQSARATARPRAQNEQTGSGGGQR